MKAVGAHRAKVHDRGNTGTLAVVVAVVKDMEDETKGSTGRRYVRVRQVEIGRRQSLWEEESPSPKGLEENHRRPL